jgi:hypothetical protein
MLMVVGAVLAGDAGALTGFTVALCNRLRRGDAELERAPSDDHSVQRVRAWPGTSGDHRRPDNHLRPVLDNGAMRESHAKPIELPSASIAQVTQRLVTEFQTRVPPITVVATVRQTRHDLASTPGNALAAEVEQSARHRLTELSRQRPDLVLVPREASRPWRPVVWLGADRPRQAPNGMLQKVLTVVAGDELASPAFAVDIGAAVPVHDVGPELVQG